MKAIFLLFVAVLLGANTANGCSGGGDDDHETETTKEGTATMAMNNTATTTTAAPTTAPARPKYERTNMTWSEEACGAVELAVDDKVSIAELNMSLGLCKWRCNDDENCTAFEYAPFCFQFYSLNGSLRKKIKCCILRKCPTPVPTPNVTQAGWYGGIMTAYGGYDGYAKVM